MALDIGKLDFAYKYPFSDEAKELITSQSSGSIEEKYLTAGLLRVNEALSKSKIEFVKTPLTELKYTYLMSYVYARMLVSASGDRLPSRHTPPPRQSESADALSSESAEGFARLSGELALNLKEQDGDFLIGLAEFISISGKSEEMRLANQQVAKGIVRLDKGQALKLLALVFEKKDKREAAHREAQSAEGDN